MGETYVWLIKVYERDYYSWVNPWRLKFKKVFTSKINAINYKVTMENKGYHVTLEKYYG